MKKSITFYNRTKEQFIKAYLALRTRYKNHVEFVYKIIHGLYQGYFIIG